VDARDFDGWTDQALVSAIASGDRLALVSLFRRRGLQVYRFAMHMIGVPATAEDITQEVFVCVLHDARRYDAGRGEVLSWLLGMTRNLVRRRLERDKVLLPLDVDVHDQAGAVGDPLHDLTRSERIALVRRAVMSLPVRYREVVLLCDLEELSYEQAAAALNCAVGTVRSRLHRARALLAAKLRDIDCRKASPRARRTRCFA
jgi:RNA polymerase sigma-70 factor, ECF subfamily